MTHCGRYAEGFHDNYIGGWEGEREYMPIPIDSCDKEKASAAVAEAGVEKGKESTCTSMTHVEKDKMPSPSHANPEI
jgi:hypothetical protein